MRPNPLSGAPAQELHAPGGTGAPLRRIYPEIGAGGFSRIDGTIGFYCRVNALLSEVGPAARIVDFGAGRGALGDDPVPFRRDLRVFRGRVDAVVGVDVDPAVLANPYLDRAEVVAPGGPIPLPDGWADLVVSDFTFEHVTDPSPVAAELTRVVRPGGWICARTPNRYGYIGLGARLVPNNHHVSFLHRLQPTKPDEDTFPVAYRLNTPAALRRWFPAGRFEHFVYTTEHEPAYVGTSRVLTRIGAVSAWLTPPPLRSVLNVFLRRRPDPD